MSKKNENPYRAESAYAKIFDAIRKSGNSGISREALQKDSTPFDVTVVLSPRKESKRGDCRGNFSAQGHIYYVIPMKGEKGKRFRLAWRNPVLEARSRVQGEVKAKKVRKVQKVTKKVAAPATSEVAKVDSAVVA